MAKEEPMWRSSQLKKKDPVGFNMEPTEKKEEKAQSHSAGKPSLCGVWEWLDQDFLMECVEQMKHPVEVDKKYPKDNWQTGVGDQAFIKARIESAQRHLTKLATSDIMKEARDDETNRHETAAVMANMMMVFHCLMGEKK